MQLNVDVLLLPIAIMATYGFMMLAMAGAFLVQRKTGQSGWIDAIWSISTAVSAVFLLLAAARAEGGLSGRHMLALGMILIWGIRLSAHIAARTQGAGDDPRYRALREGWGAMADRRMFVFLQVQAFFAMPLALAVAAAGSRPGLPLDMQDFSAVTDFVAGLLGAAIADQQLAAYRRQGRGKVCDRGLWRYSRHPNYFFEWLSWCAWPIMAFAPFTHPFGLFALVAPVLMYWLLVHASGIPPLEAHMVRSRGQAFVDYQRRTSAFFPAPPRQ